MLLVSGERFPCGPLGATGEVEAGRATLTLVVVDEEGPALAAGLHPGDQVISVDGQEFPAHTDAVDDGGSGPQRVLGEAIDGVLREEVPPANGGDVSLTLGVLREGRSLDVEVRFPRRPALSGPRRGEGRRALRAAAATQLVRSRSEAGFWDSPVGLSGDRVITAWALVALLAHGDPDHRDAIGQAAGWLRGPEGRGWLPEDYSKGPDNLGNWALTSSMIALAEHTISSETDEHLPVLEHMGRGLVARVDAEGRFGHDVTVGYDGKGFNVINTLAHLAWALGAEAGVSFDVEAWGRSFAQIEASIDPDGGVRYWTLPGTGTGDASLRTGSMALALIVRGQHAGLRDRMVHYLDVNAPRTREAHAVGSLGMLATAPALRAVDPAAYERFLEEWRWYLTLCWCPGDEVRYIGGKRNNGGDSYLGFADVACVIALQVLASEDGRLRMHHPPGP